MFNTYYQEELSFLREMGREYARHDPRHASLLESEGSDPDVERLLQGVAFLTGRIRQKVDDELPELFQSMMSLLWPHYLRPVPSTAILRFDPRMDQLSAIARIPRGTEVESIPVNGTPCRFRTSYDVDAAPIRIDAAEVERPMGTDAQLKIVIAAAGKVPLERLQLKTLRFFLADEMARASMLYLWILRYGKHLEIRDAATGRSARLPMSAIRPVGFANDESILPYPAHSFMGYRLLQEYFTCPLKFYFLDFSGMDRLAALQVGQKAELIVPFSRRPEDTINASPESVRLFCTPMVNLFAHSADGLRVDHTRTEYRIRPSTPNAAPPEHYEIYNIESVEGLVQGDAKRRHYPPLHAFQHGLNREEIYYQTRLYDAVGGSGTDTYISFVTMDERVVAPPTETISIDLTCSNRDLAGSLKAKDVRVPTTSSPEFAKFENITPVTRSLRPPLGSGLHWRLISHLSLNYLSLKSIEALRGILELYNYQAMYDRQAARENIKRLEGLVALEARPVERLIRGAPIRGMSVHLDMNEESFAGEGDMYLFATVLNEFFALYATMNSFSELKVRGTKYGEVYQWPPRLGQQSIL